MKWVSLMLASCVSLTGTLFAQDEPSLVSGPTQMLRRLYHKLSHGRRKTGVDVRSYAQNTDCENADDLDGECLERIPVDDEVTGKKLTYNSCIRYEYVVVEEVRYRWKTKWVTKEIPADYDEPVCITEDEPCEENVQVWEVCEAPDGTDYCETQRPDSELIANKRIECAPGQTTVRVRYKTCVKEPYLVYRQVCRPVALKQPCYERVNVPVTRYEGRRVKKDGE